MALHPDRLFPIESDARLIARRLFDAVERLPIISPHGHTDPSWYAKDEAFPDPASLFVKPDHYIFRMLYSQGIQLEDLGAPRNRMAGRSRPTGRRGFYGACLRSIFICFEALHHDFGSSMHSKPYLGLKSALRRKMQTRSMTKSPVGWLIHPCVPGPSTNSSGLKPSPPRMPLQTIWPHMMRY